MDEQYALLIKEVQGYKESEGSDYLTPLSYENINVPAGSLVEYLSSAEVSTIKTVYEFEVNYLVYSSGSHVQSGVILLASPDQLYKLTPKQKDFLLAVNYLTDRVEMLRKLQWVENLKIGSEVYTTIDTIPIPVKGVIRYIGELSGVEGIQFGIELIERMGKGKSDGCFQGKYYFTCERKCAVFVSMDMLTDYKVADAAKLVSDKPVPSEKKPPVRTRDHVTFSDKHGHKHRGLVRWIGTDKSLIPDGTTIVGIETEEPLDLTKIPHHMTMAPEKDYLPVVKQGSKIFLPIHYVHKEDSKGIEIKDDGQKVVDTTIASQNAYCTPFANTSTKHLPENLTSLRHNAHSSGSNILEEKSSQDNLSSSTESLDDDSENIHPIVNDSFQSLPSRSPHENLNPHNLKVGSTIYYSDPPKFGVIKWIGIIPPRLNILYAGLEMNEKFDNATDGVWAGKRYFSSKPGRGKFVPLLQLKLIESVKVGSSVQVIGSKQYGTVKKQCKISKKVDLEMEDGTVRRKVSPAQLVPDLRKEDAPAPQPILYKFEVGSAVQHGIQYGVIRQIIKSQPDGVECAQVELDTGGYREIPLSQLQPDDRFSIDVNDTEGRTNPLVDMLYEHDEKLPYVPPAKFDVHKHTNINGIQGYQNSCYLDATLYGLFAFSDAFDVLFLDLVATMKEQCIQKILKNKIVYPLREKGVVVQDSIQEFRRQLEDLQKINGFLSDEKDPEEFLNVLFKHVVHLDPFVLIRRPSGIDKEFLVQLFVEPVKGISVVHTQDLLTNMFLDQSISFVKHPSRLLLQMPRYGKRFKSFQRIVPSLELDIKELCEIESAPCFRCNRPSSFLCNDCSHEPSLHKEKKPYFCDSCSFIWHNHPNRQSHKPFCLTIQRSNDFDTRKLQLLSVLCIETSHYVCFTRVTENEWVFFDSMAERLENGYNLPKVTLCTQVLQEYVYGEVEIRGNQSRSLPDLVRRFVEDVSMCVYIDRDGVMYQ